jgi:hypothetical protein
MGKILGFFVGQNTPVKGESFAQNGEMVANLRKKNA